MTAMAVAMGDVAGSAGTPSSRCRVTLADGAPLSYWLRPAAVRSPGHLLVLVHGLASNASRWAELVEATRLAERWDLVRVDLRGHGESPFRGPLRLETWADDLAAVIADSGHPRAVVAGHSLGAQVALRCAMRQPACTAGLVLIDPVLRPALLGRWRWLARLGGPLRWAAGGVRLLNRLGFGRQWLPRLDLRALDAGAREALADPAERAAFVRRYSSARADLRCFHTASYLDELGEMFRGVPGLDAVRVPVLALLSTHSSFTDPACSRRLLAALPDSTLVDIPCHHWPLTERPVEVREAIETWCEQQFP
jgi:pimeloyl-ACP methyl ester carboxylesterase